MVRIGRHCPEVGYGCYGDRYAGRSGFSPEGSDRPMTARLTLRLYQTETIDAFEEGWADGYVRLASVLPTGMGKTVVFAELIARAKRDGRVPLVLVHREELAAQAADKIRSVDPSLSIGVVKAGRDELDADVLVCSVPTLANPARMARLLDRIAGRKRLVVVDECHHAAAPTWSKVLHELGCFSDSDLALAAGFTATMTREDSRHLGDIWQKVVPKVRHDILYGIDNGYLTDVRGKAVTVDDFDLASVARSRGDYQEGALGEALIASGAGEVIAEAYGEHAADRPGVLFAPTVDSANVFADDLNDAGIRTEVITGKTPNSDRLDIFARHRTGETQILSNCMVLTEGWDAPHTSCAVVARPTQSAGLYVQMVGRVLRPFPGKADALVLDVVGASRMHALRSIVDLTKSAVEIVGDESLAEAVARRRAEEEAERAGKPADAVRAAGQLAAVEVDLFHRSPSVWLQTYAGTWFIPTKLWTFFLWPEHDSGLWKVGRKPTWQNRGEKGGWLREGLELGYAMAWGEAEASDEDASIANKSASWRRKSNMPSDAQLGMLAKFGIPFDETTNKSKASDLISIHFASRDLDPKGARR